MVYGLIKTTNIYFCYRPVNIFNLNNIDKTQPKYLQLADVIRNAIRSGTLLAGDALPSVKSLSDDLSFNRHTVMKSLAELVAEGWLESRERIGYRVVVNIPVEQSRRFTMDDNKSSDNQALNFRVIKKIKPIPQYPSSTYKYNFSGGEPDMTLFPFNEFKSHMSDVLSRPNLNELGYGDTAGTNELRDQVKRYLRKSRGLTEREIVITNGSQEALFIVAQLLLKAGDKVAVEALGYPPAMDVFKNAGAELVGVMQDNNGIVPNDLEAKIMAGNVRLIYLTPLHQYPTTKTLSVSRRMAIYQLASTHNIPIIEDDYDHEFHFRCQPLAPMAFDDPRQLVIYISTFSKIMFPGARVGFMAINHEFAKTVEAYRMLICHKSNVLMQSALARWMKSGGFERNLRRVTRQYQQRRDHAVELLNRLDCFDFSVPDGGMALWLKIKNKQVKASNLAEKVKSSSVYIQHEQSFLTTDLVSTITSKDGHHNEYIRLGYAGMNEEHFAEGLALIVEHLK